MVSGSGGFVSRLTLDLRGITQSTYLAGNSGAFPYAVVVSGSNVYVAGWTSSTGFPSVVLDESGQDVYGGGDNDGFVSWLDLELHHILRSTYLGGSYDDFVRGIVISGGYIYVAGDTYSHDLPSLTGGAQPGYIGTGRDAFVSKVSLDLTQIVQSTYLGGANDLRVGGIAASTSDVYVAGMIQGGVLINAAGGAQPTANSSTDAFVSKVNLSLTQIVQSTYLGGSVNDWGECVAVGPDGSVYVAGQTMSSDFPGERVGLILTLQSG